MTHDADAAPPAAAHPEADRVGGRRARELNAEIRYTQYAVFRGRTDPGRLDPDRHGDAAAEVADLLDQLASKDVATRGTYDVSGYRADADYLLWWVSADPDGLQDAYARFRQTRLGRASEPVWSVLAVHRPAEFNKSHVPAYLVGGEPKRYLCVYPFVRSHEWYLLDPAERRAMLAEHGLMAREYPDVRTNTAACFALGDYEWVLGFEADELHRIVDLMRHLRGAAARRHTRLEVPFYTGVRKPVAEIIAALP
jgi:peroxiredoxin